MSVLAENSNRNWTGLMIDTPGRGAEERNLREILGSDAVLLVVRGSDAAIDFVRQILESRSSCILTVMGDDGEPILTPLLRVASTLASVRRIVVLHGASIEPAQSILRRGVLMLRDCPEVRSALTALIAREMAESPGTTPELVAEADQTGALAGNQVETGVSEALAFEACVRVESSESGQARIERAGSAESSERAMPIRRDEPPWCFRTISA